MRTMTRIKTCRPYEPLHVWMDRANVVGIKVLSHDGIAVVPLDDLLLALKTVAEQHALGREPQRRKET